MKGTAIFAAVLLAVCFPACALPPVRPALPSVAHADTEVVTNVPFAAWQEHVGKFTFTLACNATASNNVQVAFGKDADGDGTLSLAESELIAGWDCGSWFVQDGFDGERVAHVGGGQTLSWTVTLSERTATPSRIETTVDGSQAFANADAGIFYDRSWDMLRLTGRGLANSSESVTVQIHPDALSIILR